MIFAKNVGQTDKIIRLVAGVVVGAISLTQLGGFATTMGIVGSVIAAVLVLTALINFCPLYTLLGIKTNK